MLKLCHVSANGVELFLETLDKQPHAESELGRLPMAALSRNR
jgi:hypothetical protein